MKVNEKCSITCQFLMLQDIVILDMLRDKGAQSLPYEPTHDRKALFVLRKLILQTCTHSHPVGLDVWFLVWPFVYFHTSCVPEPSLVAYVISTIISWAGSYKDQKLRLLTNYHKDFLSVQLLLSSNNRSNHVSNHEITSTWWHWPTVQQPIFCFGLLRNTDSSHLNK